MEQRISLQELPQGFMEVLMKSGYYVNHSGLDPKLLRLIYQRVSQINGCAFCLDMHHKEALQLGESELRLHSLPAWRECPYYSEQERAALSLAETLTLASRHSVDDSLYHSLTEVFSKDEIANLTLAIAMINTWNRLNKTFRPVPGNYQPQTA